MDQVEKLLCALSVGTLMIIKERITEYESELDPNQDQEEIKWSRELEGTIDQMIKDKSE